MIAQKTLQELKDKGAEKYLADSVPETLTHPDDQRAWKLGVAVTVIDNAIGYIKIQQAKLEMLELEAMQERNRYEQLLTKLENINK